MREVRSSGGNSTNASIAGAIRVLEGIDNATTGMSTAVVAGISGPGAANTAPSTSSVARQQLVVTSSQQARRGDPLPLAVSGAGVATSLRWQSGTSPATLDSAIACARVQESAGSAGPNTQASARAVDKARRLIRFDVMTRLILTRGHAAEQPGISAAALAVPRQHPAFDATISVRPPSGGRLVLPLALPPFNSRSPAAGPLRPC